MTRTNAVLVIEKRFIPGGRCHWEIFEEEIPFLSVRRAKARAFALNAQSFRTKDVWEYRVVKYIATISKEPKTK